MKILSFVTLTVAFMLGACSPFQIANAEGEQPEPVIVNELTVIDEPAPVIVTEPAVVDAPASVSTDVFPTFGYQPVRVVDVYVEVTDGSLAVVDIGADLPDVCAQVAFVDTVQDGDTFKVQVGTVPSTKQDCLRDSIIFRMKVPLNVVDLPVGSYKVDVNGVRADFSIEASASTATDLRTPSMPIYRDDVLVEEVRIEVGRGSPLPVHAVVSAKLPRSCGQLGEVHMYRAGNTFLVHLVGHLPAQTECDPNPLPLRLEIPLNIVSLPEGKYEVNVNGTTTTFDIPIY